MAILKKNRTPKDSECYLDNDDGLLRLLFSDKDYYNGAITDLAISLDDLNDEKRGFSLDIERIASKKIVNERASEQAKRAKKPTDRERGYLSKLSNKAIIQELDDTNKKLFETSYSPMNGNFAHASLLCCERAGKKRSYYLLARGRLKEHLVRDIVDIDKFPFRY